MPTGGGAGGGGKASFSHREYERSHWKAPRGRGSWAFQADHGAGPHGEVKFFNGTLTEAKAQAARAFPGAEVLHVLP